MNSILLIPISWDTVGMRFFWDMRFEDGWLGRWWVRDGGLGIRDSPRYPSARPVHSEVALNCASHWILSYTAVPTTFPAY